MFGKKKRFEDMGSVKRDTNQIINETIEKQQEIKRSWATRRPKTLAVSNPKPKGGDEPIAVLPSKPSSIFNDEKKGISAYWFPILCLAAVISVAIWTFWPKGETKTVVPEPVVRSVEQKPQDTTDVQPTTTRTSSAEQSSALSFDIVRIEQDGALVIAGRSAESQNVSILINKKIVATVSANSDGEFTYTPKNKLKPGNYTIQLLSGDQMSDKVFLYVSEKSGQSVSLLMTDGISKVMQAPKKLADGSLVVSQIDYIANKRLVVQGRAIPRLRVSVSLDDKLLGMTRVSDHKNFGLGAGVGELESGKEYKLSIKLHDGQYNVVSTIEHKFTMPEMTDADETFYVVRRDDCLWIIARNFLGRGIRFSVIADANDIKNPDLIYPNQKFKIPVTAK